MKFEREQYIEKYGQKANCVLPFRLRVIVQVVE